MKKRNKNQKEGRATRQNIQKQVIKVQKLHQRLDNVHTDNINKIANDLTKTNPNGYEFDRDYNANLNLRDAKIYKTA